MDSVRICFEFKLRKHTLTNLFITPKCHFKDNFVIKISHFISRSSHFIFYPKFLGTLKNISR